MRKTGDSHLKKAWFVVRICLAILPIAWIVSRTDLKMLLSAFSRVEMSTLPILTGFILLTMFLQGMRFWLLLRAFDASISLWHTTTSHFVGLFYSLVLPTSSAQDVVRAVLISKYTLAGKAWAASWVYKLQGVIALGCLSAVGLFFVRDTIPKYLITYLCFFAILLPFFVTLSFTKIFTRPIRHLVQRYLPKKIYDIVSNIREGIYQYRTKIPTLVIGFAAAVIIQFLIVITVMCLLKGVTGTYYFLPCLTFIPCIELLCMLVPLTPNGIGLRETLLAIMFHYLNIPNDSLSIYIILALYAGLLKLLGGLFIPFLPEKDSK